MMSSFILTFDRFPINHFRMGGCCSSQKVPALIELDLSNQNLKEVPKNVAKEKALQTLLLSNNQLANLPDFFKHFSYLLVFDVTNNCINYLPLDILPSSLHVLRAG